MAKPTSEQIKLIFLRTLIEGVEKLIQQFYGVHLGVCLIIFPFNASREEDGIQGGVDYISNAHREDMIKALREAADQLETKQYIPHAEGSA
jgi:hypothetical protein